MRRIPRQQVINVYVDNTPKEDNRFICIKGIKENNEILIKMCTVVRNHVLKSDYYDEGRYYLDYKFGCEGKYEIISIEISKETYEHLKELLLNEK